MRRVHWHGRSLRRKAIEHLRLLKLRPEEPSVVLVPSIANVLVPCLLLPPLGPPQLFSLNLSLLLMDVVDVLLLQHGSHIDLYELKSLILLLRGLVLQVLKLLLMRT